MKDKHMSLEERVLRGILRQAVKTIAVPSNALPARRLVGRVLNWRHHSQWHYDQFMRREFGLTNDPNGKHKTVGRRLLQWDHVFIMAVGIEQGRHGQEFQGSL